ncbi:tRNA adenosine(34) deaminase TadA [Brevundimonas vesicularis]|uniref:tRNA adenosine(34) deaminase TadA n=1 Tax=Brevundimonas vesicularis TaxID=41276 RepID=UPI0038D390A9
MSMALDLAQAAAKVGEVPVGAIIVDETTGKVVGRGQNGPINSHDPTAHAEIIALRDAAASLQNYRLTDLTLYVTLEPCAMCAGAISHARLGRVVWAADDPKGGAVRHGPRYFEQSTCHWRPSIEGGVMAEPAAEALKTFFRARRGTRTSQQALNSKA